MSSTLPGSSRAYLIKAGEGDRFAFGGQLVTVVARLVDTADLFEAAIVSGGRGAAFPPHQHSRGHEALLVLDGKLELHLDGRRFVLTQGDYASVPPGVTHNYVMRSHYTRFLQWTIGGALEAQYAGVGTRTDAIAHEDRGAAVFDVSRLADVDADIVLAPGAGGDPHPGTTLRDSPDGVVPYVLEAGDGERLLAGDQLFTFLSDQRNTGGSFITLSTAGPSGARIPNHFHKKHTETFLCTKGAMTMWADGQEMALHPGDFLHVPAGTVHSYRLDAPYTEFAGMLTPGLFEPFFRAMCEPYDGFIFPAVPGPVRFDRVMQQLHELDLVLVDPPARPPSS